MRILFDLNNNGAQLIMLIITVNRRHKRRFLTSKDQKRVPYTATMTNRALEIQEPRIQMKPMVEDDDFDEGGYIEGENDEDSRENELSPEDVGYFENEIEQFDGNEDDGNEFDDYDNENGGDDDIDNDNESYEYSRVQRTGSTYDLDTKFALSNDGSVRTNPQATSTSTSTSMNSLSSLMECGTESSSGGISIPNFSLTQELLRSDDDEGSSEGLAQEGRTQLKKGSRRGNRFLQTNEMGDAGGSFVCDLCGKRYLHHRSLNDHKKFHMGATRCPVCNKAFSKVANMRAHYSAQHLMGKSSDDNYNAMDKSDEDQHVGQTNQEVNEFGA